MLEHLLFIISNLDNILLQHFFKFINAFNLCNKLLQYFSFINLFISICATYCCNIFNLLHTYIYNWPLQPFSQDYSLASHINHVVCVNFICEWRDLQFNIDSWRQIFWETFSWQVYFLSEFLPETCWEEVAEEIFSYFIFWWLTWDTNPGFCV